MRPKQKKGVKKVVQKWRPEKAPKTVHVPAPPHVMVVAAEKGDAAQRGLHIPAGAIVVPGIGRKLGEIKFTNEPEFRAQSTGKPCVQKRTGCPVQLIFDQGQAKLRFCKRAGNKQEGYTVPVDSPDEALAVAKQACTHWEREKTFKDYFPPGQALGGARRRR